MPTSRQPSHVSSDRRKRTRWLQFAVAALVLLLMLLWVMPKDDTAPAMPTPEALQEPGPPWRQGSADARFTIVLYADLECPYCKAYYPTLNAWIAGQPEVSLQWHHLPLPAHEPVATELAQLAECLGEAGGHAAFFEAIGWLYQHTRSDGQGLPDGLHHPGMTPAVQACVDSDRSRAVVRAQAEEGAHAGVAATPSLRLVDRQSGQSLLLQGPVEGDALLSALDLLTNNALEPDPVGTEK